MFLGCFVETFIKIELYNFFFNLLNAEIMFMASTQDLKKKECKYTFLSPWVMCKHVRLPA